MDSGEGGDLSKDELHNFLAKVDEIGDLVKALSTSSGSTESSEAIRRADEYLCGRGTRGGGEGVVTQDRTVINSAGHNSTAGFREAMEEDALERAERGRRREEEGRRLKKEGNKAFRREDYSKAIGYFTDAISQLPWDITLYTNRALAYNRMGDFSSALEDCNTAIRYEPKTLRAYIHKGTALVSLGRLREAEACYNEALELFPEHKEALEGYVEEVRELLRPVLDSSTTP